MFQLTLNVKVGPFQVKKNENEDNSGNELVILGRFEITAFKLVGDFLSSDY